jgi:SAM-dependent methyltransferase
LKGRFGGPDIGILDVGAGAGRDAASFLSQGFRVAAIEGSPKLAEFMRTSLGSEELSVHEVNLLNRQALAAALRGRMFQGIWMCSTLVHVPTKCDLVGESALMVDHELLSVLAEHLAAGGLVFLDNKLGHGAHFKERGNVFRKRWFRYRQPDDLSQLLSVAKLARLDAGWYNGLNGFDAWVWVLAESKSA